ncbi:MAG TPA: mannanase, partial [Verrucomicrobiae bacterium]
MKSPRISRRNFIKTTALAVPTIASGCAHLRGGANDFVRVRNGRFELRGKPHYYVGTNMWFGCYLSDAALPGGRARLVRELNRLQAMGVNNIRLLAGSETSDLVAAISRGITRKPHDLDQDLLAGLDFTLAEMAKRDMRGILFVSNYWQWSGSFSQYVRW